MNKKLNNQSIYIINVGVACNSGCVMCSVRNGKTNTNLTTAQILRILKKGRKEKYSRVEFTGGEPTVRNDLPFIINQARNLGYQKIGISTNGIKLCDNNYCKKLIESGLTHVTISLHAHNKELYGRITCSPNSFESTISGIKNAVESKKISVTITTNIIKLNYKYIFHIGKLIQSLHVSLWNILELLPMGLALEKYKLLCVKRTELSNALIKILSMISNFNEIILFDITPCLLPSELLHHKSLKLLYCSKKNDQFIFYRKTNYSLMKPIKNVYNYKLNKKITICNYCDFSDKCNGVWLEYLKLYGDHEINFLAKKHGYIKNYNNIKKTKKINKDVEIKDREFENNKKILNSSYSTIKEINQISHLSNVELMMTILGYKSAMAETLTQDSNTFEMIKIIRKLGQKIGLHLEISKYKYITNSPRGIFEEIPINDSRLGKIVISFSQSKERAQNGAEYYHKKMIDTSYGDKFAQLMGYPKCCYTFGHYLVNNDKNPENFGFKNPAVESLKQSKKFNWQLNVFTYTPLSHYPCSLSCKKSIEYVDKVMKYLKYIDENAFSFFTHYLTVPTSLYWTCADRILLYGDFHKYSFGTGKIQYSKIESLITSNTFYQEVDHAQLSEWKNIEKALKLGNQLIVDDQFCIVTFNNKTILKLKKSHKYIPVLVKPNILS